MTVDDSNAYIREPLRLAKADRKSLVPVVGAGLSAAVGAPMWGELIDRLRRHLGDLPDPQFYESPYDELQDLRNDLGQQRFSAIVQKAIETPRTVTSLALQAIASAEPRLILTTNLDESLEAAFMMGGQHLYPADVAASVAEADLMLNQKIDHSVIVKLHGTIARPSTWVLTRSDYDKAYLEPGLIPKFFERVVDIPLFVGYSFQDYYLAETNRLKNLRRGPRSYIILPIADIRLRQPFFKNQGIVPIGFYHYQQIGELLDEILDPRPVRSILSTVRKNDADPVSLSVGAATVVISRTAVHTDGEHVESVLLNALDFRGNHLSDGSLRRTTGQKGRFVGQLAGFSRSGQLNALRLVMLGIAQYPDVLFDRLQSVLRTRETDARVMIDVTYSAASEVHASLPKRLDRFCLHFMQDADMPYRVRRALARQLALRGRHPAQSIPPKTVQVGSLGVPIYPLTRSQVGQLSDDQRLVHEDPLRPHTIRSRQEVEDILALLSSVSDGTWRLPTEQEWLNFAGLTDGRPWPWGSEEPEVGEQAHLKFTGVAISRNMPQETVDVGLFPKGSSENGLYDLVGNVYEWVVGRSGDRLAGRCWATTYRSGLNFPLVGDWRTGNQTIGLRPVRMDD